VSGVAPQRVLTVMHQWSELILASCPKFVVHSVNPLERAYVYRGVVAIDGESEVPAPPKEQRAPISRCHAICGNGAGTRRFSARTTER
jgi:hypothetical protein